MIKYLNGIQAALYDVLSHRGLVETGPQVAHPARRGAVVEQPEEGVVQPLPAPGRRPTHAEERPEELHVPHGLRVHHGAVGRGLLVETIRNSITIQCTGIAARGVFTQPRAHLLADPCTTTVRVISCSLKHEHHAFTSRISHSGSTYGWNYT